jgi:hypothetical protein
MRGPITADFGDTVRCTLVRRSDTGSFRCGKGVEGRLVRQQQVAARDLGREFFRDHPPGLERMEGEREPAGWRFAQRCQGNFPLQQRLWEVPAEPGGVIAIDRGEGHARLVRADRRQRHGQRRLEFGRQRQHLVRGQPELGLECRMPRVAQRAPLFQQQGGVRVAGPAQRGEEGRVGRTQFGAQRPRPAAAVAQAQHVVGETVVELVDEPLQVGALARQ